ncbi:hypothetical protein PENSPDRAFT_640249 [Peniophora sp. CONT]|nr:hypothetical protein PENSPDRAFT_640249 [Peniophora sp. CONT]
MSSSDPRKVDVLIVGAGPAGIMAALSLLKCGVEDIKLIDFAPKKTVGYADGVMPRTIEVQSYGVDKKLFEICNRIHRFALRMPAVPKDTQARYPMILNIPQGPVEDIMLEPLNAQGIFVERLYSPSDLSISSDEKELQDPDAYPVTAVLKSQDEQKPSQLVHAKFVLGADGAHSATRRLAGIKMEGSHTPHVWAAIDFLPSPESNFPDWRNITTIDGDGVNILLIPREGNQVRLYIELGSEEGFVNQQTGRVDLSRCSAEQLLSIAKKVFTPYIMEPASMRDVVWWTVYGIGQRVADKFSVHERVFIAGDACHTHSPKAGQGMNTSINDAHNFGWKLAYVLRGLAPMSLLKTYELERRAFAQELIEFDKWYAEGRTDLTFRAFIAASHLTSGCGVHYAPSSIVAKQSPSVTGLVVGKRILPQMLLRSADHVPVEIQDLCPSDGRLKIFVFVGNLTSPEERYQLVTLSSKVEAVLSAYPAEVLSVLTVVKTISDAYTYFDIPTYLRPDWTRQASHYPRMIACSRLLVCGNAYSTYGIADDGAFVVVRPDGYVGLTAPLNGVKSIGQYFGGFLKHANSSETG